MQNPVVVFIRKDRVDALKDKIFPIGLSLADGMDAPTQTKEYAVILLDDAAQIIPESRHSNMDANAPLLVVAHGGSGHHKAADISTQLEDAWGRTFVHNRFSHISDDSIFKEIGELIIDPKTNIERFVTKFRNKSQLEWLDGLAAVCQLKLIDSAVDTEELENEILALLGTSFSTEFGKVRYSDGSGASNWKTALAHIQSKAGIFVGSA